MKTITIDRSIWLRGEGSNKSRLLRTADNKMCCIGVALLQCGIPITDLEEISTVNHLIESGVIPTSEFTEEDIYSEENQILTRAYEINDNSETSDADKESALIPIFEQLGFNLEFID